MLYSLYQVKMPQLLNWLQLYRLTFISFRQLHHLHVDWVGPLNFWMPTLFLDIQAVLGCPVTFSAMIMMVRVRVSPQKNLVTSSLSMILMDTGKSLGLLMWASLWMLT
jgi:hypothetical protein